MVTWNGHFMFLFSKMKFERKINLEILNSFSELMEGSIAIVSIKAR